MGFIREPEGVDFVIAPSLTVKEDIACISNYIQQHKAKKIPGKHTGAKVNPKLIAK
jgi:hypothetical protein